jgi:hypothetical protein
MRWRLEDEQLLAAEFGELPKRAAAAVAGVGGPGGGGSPAAAGLGGGGPGGPAAAARRAAFLAGGMRFENLRAAAKERRQSRGFAQQNLQKGVKKTEPSQGK